MGVFLVLHLVRAPHLMVQHDRLRPDPRQEMDRAPFGGKWMQTANGGLHAFRAHPGSLAFAYGWSIDGALPIAAVERKRGNLDFEMFAAGSHHAVGADHET